MWVADGRWLGRGGAVGHGSSVLCPANDGVVGDGKEKAGKAGRVYLVTGQACSDADGVVIGALHIRDLYVPVGLVFVGDHGEHLDPRVIDELDTDVASGMVRAGGVFVDGEALVDETEVF